MFKCNKIFNCCFILLNHFINIANIYPRGFAGSMREYSEKFHQIHCWEEHWDDYENILLEFINFLKVHYI